jgi:hypothetical protein
MTFLNRSFPNAIPRIWSLAATLLTIGVGLWLPHTGVELAGKMGSVRGTVNSIGGSAERVESGVAGEASPRTLEDAIRFMQVSRDALQQVADYTALFSKTERVDDRVIEQAMEIKQRRTPFSVYLRCCSKREMGREVIFVDGANNGNLLVHEAGIKSLAGTLRLEPDDPQVMDENRYPITKIGIERMLETVLAVWDAEKAIDAANVSVKVTAGVKIGSRECEELEVAHRQRVAGLKFHKTRLFIDNETKLPVQVEQYDWPATPGGDAPLVERYTYTDIQPNIGLTDDDFDPHNSKYRF